MKADLLRKCRVRIKITNHYGLQPQKYDKKIMVVRFANLKWIPCKNSKGGIYYSKLGNAIIKRREEILKLAKEVNSKSFLFKLFF